MARLPGTIKAGSSDDAHLCSNLDFAQTFLDFAGIKAAPEEAKMQGQTLRPILAGKSPKSWRDAVYYRYWMHLAHHHIPGHYGIRDARYKLAFFYGLPLDATLGKGDYPPSPAGWELYDLEADPSEINNVYNKPEYASVIKGLKSKLLELKKQYGDQDDAYPELMKLRESHWDK